MHIALFGGSFDPPHNSHVMVAQEVLKDLPEIDEVWLLPDNQHHWKQLQASPQDRLTMLKFLETERIKIADIAIRKGGKTYTLDIIKQLQETTDYVYVWICGADQVKDFHRWGDTFKELEERIQFIIYPRLGYAIPTILPKNAKIMKPNDFIATDDNSTLIRERVKQGESIAGLVPEKVEEYIREKGLYK